MVAAATRVRAAMILCAGRGTRLQPLTSACAKPMVPIGDAPALAHVTERVRLAPGLRIVVNVHHRAEDVKGWAEGEAIAVSEESQLLGTAGGIACASRLLGEGDVLVWNGDILSDLDPRELLCVHERGHAHATLAVRPREAGAGNVGFTEDGCIVRLRQECFGQETRGGEFLGIHAIGESLRGRLPVTGCLVGDVYLPALRRGEYLRAYVSDAPFLDIGTIAQYLAANAAWLAARSLRSWSHKTAKIRAAIDGSVIGAGAVIEAPTIASVVWPNARVTSACTKVVVTPNSSVSIG